MEHALLTIEGAVGYGWGLAFGFLGLGVLLVGLLGLDLYLRARETPFHPALAFWWAVGAVYARRWARLRCIGPSTVPAQGPVIVVANHTCAIDPLLVIACTSYRVPAYMVALEYSNPPLLGRVLKMVECIPVRRDGQDTAATRAALRHLKAGKALGIFIEGRIALPGETLDAKDGTAMLALHSGATVVPVHISGTRWHESVIRTFLKRHRARVRFGEPIDLRREVGERVDKADVPRVSAMILQRIRDLDPAKDSTTP